MFNKYFNKYVLIKSIVVKLNLKLLFFWHLTDQNKAGNKEKFPKIYWNGNYEQGTIVVIT